MDKQTKQYRLDQVSKVKNPDYNYNNSIKLFGGLEGNTNQMDITKEEYLKICRILTEGLI